jgi:Sigma-54 interaction domain
MIPIDRGRAERPAVAVEVVPSAQSRELRLAWLGVFPVSLGHWGHGSWAQMAESSSSSFHGIIGQSAAMRALFAEIERFAPVDVPVLIRGESGMGKELVARAVQRLSRRRGGLCVGWKEWGSSNAKERAEGYGM